MLKFNDFIQKDITAKKTLISTLPTKTKANKKKFNLSIETIEEKYNEYKSSVRNYLLAKSRSFNVEDEESNSEKINEEIVSLEHVKFLLNPSNTYFEKMGFDTLLYQLNNYYIFNFNSLNDIINSFLDKFESVGIRLTGDDFNYTCYVHEYMSSFLEVRYKKNKKYDKVSEIFEQIYWVNPDIIAHIELNFRKLIRENAKQFDAYILRLQRDVMHRNNITNYVGCMEKLKSAYIELSMANKEELYEIVNMAKANEFDINQYLENSKVRIAAFESLIPNTIDYKDSNQMNKVCIALEKLKSNIEEYDRYLEFTPLFDSFKEEYQSLKDSNNKEYKGLKNVEEQIATKEKELDRLNRKIFGGKPGFFEFKSDNDLKHLKIESVRKAKELYELYKEYDKEYFKDIVL